MWLLPKVIARTELKEKLWSFGRPFLPLTHTIVQHPILFCFVVLFSFLFYFFFPPTPKFDP